MVLRRASVSILVGLPLAALGSVLLTWWQATVGLYYAEGILLSGLVTFQALAPGAGFRSPTRRFFRRSEPSEGQPAPREPAAADSPAKTVATRATTTDAYAIEAWHELFLIDPRNHSRHTSITRLEIKALAETVPSILWYSHYTGEGPQTDPRTAGPPVVAGADFVGYAAATETAPRWTGWILRFDRPLLGGEAIEISIVQTFHDTKGSFKPVFGVEAPIPAKRLVIEVDFPARAVPARVHGYGAGAHPAQRVIRPVSVDKLLGKAVMVVARPVPGRSYWLEWNDPPTGSRRSLRSHRPERRRIYLPFNFDFWDRSASKGNRPR